MVTVINPTSEKSIQKLWATYHTINIIAACTAVPLWFFSPFLTRDIDSNGVHKFFRGFSIFYGLTASGVTLILSSELTKLKPKIDALNKREQAEFKHSLASDLWLAQGRNTAIAQLLLSDAVPSAPSEDVRNPEGTLEEEYSDLKDTPSRPSKTSEGTLSRVREGEGTRKEGELSKEAESFFEDVVDALEDGLSDYKIVESVLGYKGRNYKEGKAILEEIKRFLELEENDND